MTFLPAGNLMFVPSKRTPTGHGETFTIEQFDLWFEPHRRAIPIYIAAVFPKMTALCGELADGIILTRSTLDTAANAREHIATGAARDAAVVDLLRVGFALLLAGGRLFAVLRAALRENLAALCGAGILVATFILAGEVVLRGFRLATLFASHRTRPAFGDAHQVQVQDRHGHGRARR